MRFKFRELGNSVKVGGYTRPSFIAVWSFGTTLYVGVPKLVVEHPEGVGNVLVPVAISGGGPSLC